MPKESSNLNLASRTIRANMTSAANTTVSMRERNRAAEAGGDNKEPAISRRIAFLAPRLELRGSVSQALTLAAQLSKRGHHLLFADAGGPLEKSAEALESDNLTRVRWEERPQQNAIGYFSRRRLLRQLDAFDPELIHVPSLSWKTPWREVAAKLDVPMVATVHSARATKRIDPREFSAFERIIAVSHDAREAVVNHGRVPREQVDLVFPGVNAIAKEALTARATSRANMIPVLACIGPLTDKAGLRTLLRAASLLLAADVEVRILIVGQGRYEGYLRDWIAEYNLGYLVILVNELFTYSGVMDLADLFLIPSESSDQGHFALEAMARGIPPILSGSGGNYELVADNQTGLIFKEGDAESLANAVMQAATQPELRKTLGQAAWDAVKTQRSAQNMAMECESVYERAISYR